MLRSTRWYARELERRERAWQTERAELVTTICRLAGNPAAAPIQYPEPDDTETVTDSDDFDFVQPDFI